MSVPSPEQQINSAYRASATKEVLRSKIVNFEQQSLLILKITTSVTFRAGAIILYIDVLVMAKVLLKRRCCTSTQQTTIQKK